MHLPGSLTLLTFVIQCRPRDIAKWRAFYSDGCLVSDDARTNVGGCQESENRIQWWDSSTTLLSRPQWYIRFAYSCNLFRYQIGPERTFWWDPRVKRRCKLLNSWEQGPKNAESDGSQSHQFSSQRLTNTLSIIARRWFQASFRTGRAWNVSHVQALAMVCRVRWCWI